MIYTVTLNPALDYILRLPRLSSEDVNRADSAQLLCGGKGINVSMVLSGHWGSWPDLPAGHWSRCCRPRGSKRILCRWQRATPESMLRSLPIGKRILTPPAPSRQRRK